LLSVLESSVLHASLRLVSSEKQPPKFETSSIWAAKKQKDQILKKSMMNVNPGCCGELGGDLIFSSSGNHLEFITFMGSPQKKQ